MVYSQHVPNDGAMNINPNAHILPSIHIAFVIHTGINESGKEAAEINVKNCMYGSKIKS